MLNPELYPYIFKRKSIRKYINRMFDTETKDKVTEIINKAVPLYTEIKTELKLLNYNEINSLAAVKAPHYIALYSEQKDGYLENTGFILQQISLELLMLGIGSCWLGMAKPKAIKSNELEFVYMLCIGFPDEPLFRENLKEFNRKRKSEISDIKDKDKLIEAVRLAPSAVNNQPWLLTGDNGIINIFCKKQNPLRAVLYEKLNKADIGIALCHLALALEKTQKEAVIKRAQGKVEHNGFYHIATLINN